jgi:hypothetical protein
VCDISYSPSGDTNQDVVASLIDCTEVVTVTNSGNATDHTFTGNDSFIFNFVDHVGNTGSKTATVNWIDKTLPQITNLTYTPDSATSGNVEVSITLNEAGIMAGRSTSDNLTFTKIYSANVTETLNFTDVVGNANSTGIFINWIDKTLPVATNVSYSPSTATNGSVEVTLVLSEAVQALAGRNQGGDATTRTKSYSNNITTTIDFYDLVGNTNSTGINITRIDTAKPSILSTNYNPDSATSGDVEVSITASKTIQKPAGRNGNSTGTVFTKIYTGNIDTSFLVTDLVGNTGETEIHINYIDKTAPYLTLLTYSPSSNTNTDVEVSIEASETIQKPAGRNGSTTGTVFTKIYSANATETITFYDLVGNQGQS